GCSLTTVLSNLSSSLCYSPPSEQKLMSESKPEDADSSIVVSIQSLEPMCDQKATLIFA
ncbi:hypothetical protein THAOC_01513, partial [Thalassiosira oceanica]